MTGEERKSYVESIRQYVINNLSLSQLSDEELAAEIERIAENYFSDKYIPVDEKVIIVEQVYSSIRGFGILDAIMKNDDITEVMVNGPNDIFIEKNGKLEKLNQFCS